MGRAGIVIFPEFLAKPGRKNRSNGREVLGADLNGSEWGVATTSRLPPDHCTMVPEDRCAAGFRPG
jgi:hypothetical protein